MFEASILVSLLFSAAVAGKALVEIDLFEKILFLNSATSLGGLFICMLGTVKTNDSYLDIALIYFLLSAIATNAYLKYFMEEKKNREGV